MKSIIYGNLTLDHNFIAGSLFVNPGGASFYIARTLNNFGLKTTVISSYGVDFPKYYLSKTRFFPSKPDHQKTLIFRNEYAYGCQRKQSVANITSSYMPSLVEADRSIFKNQDLVFIAPILNNLNLKDLNILLTISAQALKILLPQGLFRKSLNGMISTDNTRLPETFFHSFNIIIVSEKDHPSVDKKAEKWGQGKTVVIVTRADHPASVYYKGKRRDYQAFSVKDIKDETGSGDIFAAAFAFSYFKSGKIGDSVIFAHAAAALSLPLFPKEIKYKVQTVLNFIKDQHIKLKL